MDHLSSVGRGKEKGGRMRGYERGVGENWGYLDLGVLFRNHRIYFTITLYQLLVFHSKFTLTFYDQLPRFSIAFCYCFPALNESKFRSRDHTFNYLLTYCGMSGWVSQ